MYRKLAQESSGSRLPAGFGTASSRIAPSSEGLRWRSLRASATLAVGTLVTLPAKFHHPWCRSIERAEIYENPITITPKCATIGTVQESFPASHGTGFYPGPRGLFQGPTSGNQVLGKQQQDGKHRALRRRDSICQNRRMNRTEVTGRRR